MHINKFLLPDSLQAIHIRIKIIFRKHHEDLFILIKILMERRMQAFLIIQVNYKIQDSNDKIVKVQLVSQMLMDNLKIK
jgi:hypothetical protein